MEHYKIITITHRHTDLKHIADFVLSEREDQSLKMQLHDLKQSFEMEELLYLATCNRVTYFFTSQALLDEPFLIRFFQAINPRLNSDQALNTCSTFDGAEALAHLFDVAASVDSLVVGEREILRQLREAYEQSKDWGLTGDDIRIAMNSAVKTAKETYANTRIGEKPISVVSLAIQKLLAQSPLKDSRILMVGAGQTNVLAGKFLKKHGFSNVKVFNRTLERAISLSNLVGGVAAELNELGDYKEGFDVLFVCTGATEPIIDVEIYSKILNGDTKEKIIIDLSIPHNTHPRVVEKFNVNYIEIEGLRNLAKQNLAFREREVKKAKEYITANVHEFNMLYTERQLEKALHEVPAQIKLIKQRALKEVFKKEVESLDEDTLELVDKMLSYMEKKCISIPMIAAKKAILK